MMEDPLPHLLPAALDETGVFASLFRAYPDALLLVDAEGQIVMANPAAASLLGYELHELVGLAVEALVPDAMRSRHAAYRHGYASNPHTRPMGNQMDLVARRRDGSEVMVEIALSPVRNQGIPLVVTAIRGIGAYPRVKQALQRARYSEHLARLGRLSVDTRDPQLLLQQVPAMAAEALQVEAAAVYLLDSTRLQFLIAAGTGLVAQEREGLRLPSTPDVLPGYVLQENAPVRMDDARQETRFRINQVYLDAGLVCALAVPLSDFGRTVGVLAVRSRQPGRFGDDEVAFLASMGNLLTTSLQRAQTEEALAHAQRLESVGQLTGGIAHDFNNLLTVIQGNLQVLEELPAIEGDGYAQQLVSAASRASKRGAELTGKLLAFSRRQVLQPGQVDVVAMLKSLADMLRRTLDQRIRIEVETAPDCLPCMADPAQLESALLNIAINARDAMPDGGTLTFSARPCAALPASIPPERADAEGPQEGGYMAIAVKDTGLGMSDEVKERAFEPFFTTKEAGRGTGLGLSTVYGFLKQSHGAVDLESALGVGTTVTMYIPAAWQQQAPVASHPGARGSEVPEGLRVMLVEDDPEVRSVVHTFLQAFKCEVVLCSSGEEALALLQGQEAFDLLLSDIALGAGMRGMELARHAVAARPGLAVVLMSGFSSDLLNANRDAPPEWELLQKPYGRADLARAIARVLSPAGEDADEPA